MKLISLIFFAIFSIATLQANELSNAYKKEFTFLKAQKNALEKRLKSERKTQANEVYKAKKEVQNKQDKFVSISKTLKNKEHEIEKANEHLRDKTSNTEIINSVIIQAKVSLDEYGIKIDENAVSKVDTLKKAFLSSQKLYETLSSVRNEYGKFYLLDGTIAHGELVKVGNIAAYGISTKASGALAPAGNGEYKLWNKLGSEASARALYNKETPKQLDIFVFENLDKDVEYREEKTLGDTIKGGGVIGYIILGLGAFGLLLLVLRVIFLIGAGTNVKQITAIVSSKLEVGKGEDAYEAIKDFKGSTARVIRATLRNIKRDREHIEDIVMENILNESSALDRFGSFILVLAAVAPLLGLLGTVTGMISTFDIITVHGTGDPKLLSGGISEALVTTMLGLVVAIPLLLLGNLLSGWASSIKDSMEQSALHVVNLYEKHNA
ncbi:MAG: MotA/TolQ/ExbB proton channel family protein [Thiovulaceae bacterium]|nr:MotA/TolQ/ExbB proton channel family protein [Sulfurimonadaceae bacterium]MCW9026651.1 MotA/TolQ/ExbB proton channel family protein [Sulfurimonadaceae bacterium]